MNGMTGLAKSFPSCEKKNQRRSRDRKYWTHSFLISQLLLLVPHSSFHPMSSQFLWVETWCSVKKDSPIASHIVARESENILKETRCPERRFRKGTMFYRVSLTFAAQKKTIGLWDQRPQGVINSRTTLKWLLGERKETIKRRTSEESKECTSTWVERSTTIERNREEKAASIRSFFSPAVKRRSWCRVPVFIHQILASVEMCTACVHRYIVLRDGQGNFEMEERKACSSLSFSSRPHRHKSGWWNTLATGCVTHWTLQLITGQLLPVPISSLSFVFAVSCLSHISHASHTLIRESDREAERQGFLKHSIILKVYNQSWVEQEYFSTSGVTVASCNEEKKERKESEREQLTCIACNSWSSRPCHLSSFTVFSPPPPPSPADPVCLSFLFLRKYTSNLLNSDRFEREGKWHRLEGERQVK